MKGALPLKIASLEMELEVIKSELEDYKKKKTSKSFKDLHGLWKGKDFSLARIKSGELKPSFQQMFYIVDTHALIWFLTSSPRLSKKVFKILNDSESLIIISTLVLAEIKFLSEKARIEKSFSEIVEILQNDSRVKIHPIDLSVVENAPKGLDIHDSLICGTALVYQKFLQEEEVRLITKDKEIINAKVIETLW